MKERSGWMRGGAPVVGPREHGEAGQGDGSGGGDGAGGKHEEKL